MSVSIQHQFFQQFPAYHKGLWAIDSTNNEINGFQYVVDVYSATSNTFLGRFTPRPRPYDGYGLWNPSVLAPLIDNGKDIYPGMSGWTSAYNSEVHYYLSIGEQNSSWEFDDNFYDTGYVGFTSSTQQHGFIVGDSILITQDADALNGEYDGISTVIQVDDPYSLVIAKNFGLSGPLNPGTARKSDGTSFIVTGLTQSIDAWVYGASLDRKELSVYSATSYMLGTTVAIQPLLTDMPDVFTMREDARMMLMVPNYSGNVTSIRFNTYDAGGSIVGAYVYSMSAPEIATKRMLYVTCGPWDLNNGSVQHIFGANDFLNSAVTHYTMAVYDSQRISDLKTIDLDRGCAGTEYNILFMDRKGTFNTFSFTSKDTISFENKKKTFIYDGIGEYGPLGAGGFQSRTESRGYTVYDSRTLKSITVRSKDMTEEESEYIMELFSSPIVYWMKTPTEWYPIVVNDYNVVQQAFESDALIEYEVQFSMASNENINW